MKGQARTARKLTACDPRFSEPSFPLIRDFEACCLLRIGCDEPEALLCACVAISTRHLFSETRQNLGCATHGVSVMV